MRIAAVSVFDPEDQITLFVNKSTTIEEVKQMIGEFNSINFELLSIIWSGQYLSQNQHDLAWYEIEHESTLYFYQVKIPLLITINDHFDRPRRLSVSHDFTVMNVKQVLKCFIGVNPTEQKIHFNNYLMNNDDLLSKYEMVDGTILNLPKVEKKVALSRKKVNINIYYAYFTDIHPYLYEVCIGTFPCCPLDSIDIFPLNGRFCYKGKILKTEESLFGQGIKDGDSIYFCPRKSEYPGYKIIQSHDNYHSVKTIMGEIKHIPRMRSERNNIINNVIINEYNK